MRLESHPIDAPNRHGSRSRIGGDPDVPSDFAWPMYRDVPQSFIAQIDLAEVQPLLPDVLPASGLLSFFYDSEQSVWGFDPAEVGASRVAYFANDRALHSRTSPLEHPKYVGFDQRWLVPKPEISFCPWESFDLETLGLARDEVYAYADVLSTDPSPTHRLLGHPSPVQGDMQLECQLVSSGLYCGNSSGYEDPRAASSRAGASDWRLLLQIDTDDDANMMWGDCGMLYWWMRDDDIRNGRWDRAHLILQCS
ncbi:MAG: YwqG family protein [Ilumatobacteraceae bacterium]